MNKHEITLRVWRREDAPRLAELADNFEIARWLRDGFPHPYTLDAAHAYIDAVLAEQPGQSWQYALCVDGVLAGSVGAFRGKDVGRRGAEIGYWLGEPYWGRGLMTEAVRLLCDKLFAETDVVRLEAMPYAPNEGSCRVLEKCGFVLEGTLRKHVFKHGHFMDSKLYALVRGTGEAN